MSETVGSIRPTSGRLRSAVAVEGGTAARSPLGLVNKDVTAEKRTPTPDMTEIVTVSKDADGYGTDVTATQQGQQHVRRPVTLRQRTAGRTTPTTNQVNSRLTSDIVVAASVAAADDDDTAHEQLSDTGNLAPESASVNQRQETSNKDGVENSEKTSPKRQTRRRRKKTTTAAAAGAAAGGGGGGEEDVENVFVPTDDTRDGQRITAASEQSSEIRKEVSSAPVRRRKTRTSKRPGRVTALEQRSKGDYQLEIKNPEIKDWLRRKNRLLRKQRAEERRKERQRKRMEDQERNVAEERRAASAKKVSEWMKNKLLKQRQESEQRPPMSQADKISAVIHQTFALETPDTDRYIAVQITSNEHSAPDAHSAQKHVATTDVVSDKRLPKSATPRVHSRMLPETENNDRPPPTRISLPQGELQSVSTANAADHETRMSFDEWLLRKRRQAAASRRQTDRTSPNHDDAENDLIRQVARQRIETILASKKRVDSGRRTRDSQLATGYPALGVSGASPAASSQRHRSLDPKTVEEQRAVIAADAEGQTEGQTQGEGQSAGSAATHRNARIIGRPMRTVYLSNSLPPRTTITYNPHSTFPLRSGSPVKRRQIASRSETGRSTAGDSTSDDPLIATFVAGNSLTVTKLHGPKPEVKPSKAYSVVKYQQKSWDKFSDYVWIDVNRCEGGEDELPVDRPEPVGSEIPQTGEDNTSLEKQRADSELVSLANHDHCTLDESYHDETASPTVTVDSELHVASVLPADDVNTTTGDGHSNFATVKTDTHGQELNSDENERKTVGQKEDTDQSESQMLLVPAGCPSVDAIAERLLSVDQDRHSEVAELRDEEVNSVWNDGKVAGYGRKDEDEMPTTTRDQFQAMISRQFSIPRIVINNVEDVEDVTDVDGES